MVNGADTAETDSDAEAVQEVAQQAMGSGDENFVGGGGAMGEPSVVSNDSRGRHADDYSLVQVRGWGLMLPSAHFNVGLIIPTFQFPRPQRLPVRSGKGLKLSTIPCPLETLIGEPERNRMS